MHQRVQTGCSGWSDLLVQSVTDYAIYMLDPNGVVVSWNAGAERFKGYKAEEIIGQHFSRFYPEEDRLAEVPARALRTSAAEGRFEAEGWRVRKDGSRFWANVVIDPIRGDDGRLIGFAKVTRDLTERRLAEEDLRRSEERFRLLVQGVTDYAIYMLDPSGFITSWNAGAERFKGYTESEIIGEHFSKFYTQEEAGAGVPARALRTAIEQGHFEAEGWRVRKDGTRFWANVVIDPIRRPDGELVGFAKITRDLTERRETQLALEQSREAFFQSQKLEAIGKLTGGVAHDFNNLLSAIIGSLDLAERRLAAGQDIAKFLANARSAAERGAILTQRMLAFARKQELQLETVDLANVVRDMADLLDRTIGARITIDTQFPLKLPQATADPVQLELALLNLVVNARDALPDGGTIRIAARRASDDEAYVCLSVSDDGEGMDAQTLEQATEPFFTTKGIGKGTGLGLSMVQGMAEQCGGRFELHSAAGQGTTAELWLPITENGVADERQCAAPPLPKTAALDILAVDDDAIVLMNTAMVLEDLGHRVHEATSAAQALAMLGDCPIDLLITDYAMPEMTGDELVEKARSLKPDLPVIVASGYADLPHGRTICAPRLAKPFSEVELAKAVAAAIKP
ncbi:MAG TPA: PAS domain S-box protein [Novosphingobium sp.]|nr:PAS domain S-box protein [Novosphingobium sp.]